LVALARVEVFRGRLEESAAYAEEGAALSRQLAERPPSQTILPTATSAITGLAASWRAGNKAIEIQCLTYLAYDRIFQGRLQEGLAIGREAHGISRELPERSEAMSAWALSLGFVEIGEYEEALMLARRGVELARKAQDMYLLAVNLDRLGRAHEALLNLEEARAAYAEPLGQQYEPWSAARLCVVAALSENWEEAYTQAKRANEAGVFANNHPLSVHVHYEVQALLRGGDEQLAREEVHGFAKRAQTNERVRIAYLLSLAILGEWEGDPERARDHLREAEELAGMLGLPGELWRIQAALGELYEHRGEDGEARETLSQAAQILRTLAEKIENEELRGRFLSAPQARRVLERS
jgi:tetratricopeptide (TPR) repeat protein